MSWIYQQKYRTFIKPEVDHEINLIIGFFQEHAKTIIYPKYIFWGRGWKIQKFYGLGNPCNFHNFKTVQDWLMRDSWKLNRKYCESNMFEISKSTTKLVILNLFYMVPPPPITRTFQIAPIIVFIWSNISQRMGSFFGKYIILGGNRVNKAILL